MTLVRHDGRAAGPSQPQEHLVKLLQRARSWWQELVENNLTASDIARQHGVTPSYTSRILQLNFLAPELIEMILAGEHPVSLTPRTLLTLHNLPLAWSEQSRELHII